MSRFVRVLLVALTPWLLLLPPLSADIPDGHKPDPKTVRKDGTAYRYTQAGWVVLHIEGDPYSRGYQHGKLLAPEIAKYAATLARERNAKDPAEGRRTVRTLTDALFLRKFDKEFLEEMKGIADGAAEAGAKVDDRKIDLLDIDCKPTKGHRFVMQGFPGAVWSSQDYYMNEAGILLCETTIDQTPFDSTGEPLTTRCRKAIQYSNSIDDVVKYLTEKNNGLYTNEWLIADTKTNEIAMYELGTKQSKLWRSSKNEWFCKTKGFYWGCNNAKDPAVRMEALPANDKPTDKFGWEPDDRDIAWLKFYQKYKGKIDANAARAVFAGETLASTNNSLDAKFTTTALAKNLASYALYGPPTGKTRYPTEEEIEQHPGIKPLRSHPWTLLTIKVPETTTSLESNAKRKVTTAEPAELLLRGIVIPQR